MPHYELDDYVQEHVPDDAVMFFGLQARKHAA